MLSASQIGALKQAVHGLAGNAGELIMHGEVTWRSITFSGTRHTMLFAFDGTAAIEQGEQLVARLPDHSFAIPGQLVAAADVTAVERRCDPPRMLVDCSLLLLEDA